MAIGKSSSILTIGLIVASTVLLASSLLPVVSTTAAPQTPKVSKTFTISGDDLNELKEQARKQVNSISLATPVEERALTQINKLLEKHFSAGSEEAGINIRCTLTITYPPLTITLRCDISTTD